MSFVVVFLVVVVALFLFAYITKRRFGVLGLALAAGAMLNELWVGSLVPMISAAGVVLVQPPLQSVVSAGLILLPAILLLFSGPVYKSKPLRIVGAAAFALLAATLLFTPFGGVLAADSSTVSIYNFLLQYQAIIITAALIYALADLLVTKTPKHRGREH